jgi:DNA-binding MarR family transcriptional regulator
MAPSNEGRKSVWVRSRARYAVVPADALRDDALSRMEKLVLAVLCCYQNTEGRMWPFQSTLAAALQVDTRTVKRCIKGLANAGWITRHYNRSSHQIIYEVLWEKALNNAAATSEIVSEQGTPESLAPPKQGTPESPATVESTGHQSPLPTNQGTRVSQAGDTGAPHNITSYQDQPGQTTRPATPLRASLGDPSGTSGNPPKTVEEDPEKGMDEELPRAQSAPLSDGSLPPGTPPGVVKAITAIRANNERFVAETNRRPKVVTTPSGKGRVAVAEMELGVDAAVAAYQVAYAKAFGAEQVLGKSGRAQIRSLVKDYGLEMAKNMLVFVVEKWNTLAPRWRATGFPEPKIVLFRAKSLGTEMASGLHGYWKPVPSRDEREARAQESRQRMYDDKDSPKKSGWDGWMNAGKNVGA